MGKTIIALLVALVVGFSLVGCKEQAPATQPPAEESVEMPAVPEAPPMEEAAPMEGEAPAEGMEEAAPAEEMPAEGSEMKPMEEAEPAPEAPAEPGTAQ
ncbi:MAG: hypothetical protein C4532_01305 [Candidatus Abyssobacteria bacterium SURF_17]|jgi:predicted small lipoprotein YifL|uniref:Uncharacterized protein n=1 Tax=Candidatus Abyssobacteria bacterium SURF_17 TaxID=2093361 RepID=A0A419F8W3_9BACT|nr:MAG: hypothetical protein C4532_01305 [Candidatus Abyssubacteria bacterium SURF_17]